MTSRSIVPLAGEVWKDIPWTGGIYQVSNKGRVRRTRGWSGHEFCFVSTQSIDTSGYLRVQFRFQGRLRQIRSYRLVAEAFIGPRPRGLQVNHKDGNKSNNTPENLEYVTAAENIRHAFRTGLNKGLPPKCIGKGVKPHNCSSQFLGVRWHKGNKSWDCQIRFKGKICHLGCFKTEEDAKACSETARGFLRQFEEGVGESKYGGAVDDLV